MRRTGAVTGLTRRIEACRHCAGRFAATATAHAPRPVVWLSSEARILVASQAPGARVHASGVPFDDASGDRLRDWMGIDRATFYDRSRIAVLPMAFCFPGYDARGADLPPPPECKEKWHGEALAAMPQTELTLLIGGYAQAYHLGDKAPVSERVQNWRRYWPRMVTLPHPSWRNGGWLKRNPCFEAELVPLLRSRVAELLRKMNTI